MARQGRTVLFVSHNMAAVESLCRRVIWLRDGGIALDGAPARVISGYLHTALATSAERVWADRATAPGTAQVRLHRLQVRPADGAPSEPVTVHTPVSLEAEYWNDDPDARLWMSLCLYNEQDVLLFDLCPPQNAAGRDSPARPASSARSAASRATSSTTGCTGRPCSSGTTKPASYLSRTGWSSPSSTPTPSAGAGTASGRAPSGRASSGPSKPCGTERGSSAEREQLPQKAKAPVTPKDLEPRNPEGIRPALHEARLDGERRHHPGVCDGGAHARVLLAVRIREHPGPR